MLIPTNAAFGTVTAKAKPGLPRTRGPANSARTMKKRKRRKRKRKKRKRVLETERKGKW